MTKNILLVFIFFLSFSVFSQNQKYSTLDYKKTEKSENRLSEKKKKKKKKKKKDENSSKTDYSVKTKKETKKRKAKNSAPHIDASQTRKNTARKVSNKL